MTKRRLSIVLALVLSVCASPAFAQTQAPATQQWWERITFGGDFRFRYEGFFQDERPARNRERFRLRLTVRTDVTPEIALGVRLASGNPSDLVSTNQSFGELFARKPINIDQAFVTYTPAAFQALTLGGGKFGYPVRRTQMIWDDDLNWEGTYEQLAGRVGSTALRVVAVQSPINEVSATEDAFLIGVYGEAGWTFGRHSLTVSVADYNFLHEDQIAVAVDRLALTNANTNLLTRDAAGLVTGFASEFNLIDTIATGTVVTRWPNYPVTLLADFVRNVDAATDQDTGAWVTAGVGRAATPKTAAFTYTYGRIEQDAVMRTFNFSDIPGTNVSMNMLAASYMPAPRLNIDFTTILTKPLVSTPGPAANMLTRIQLDARVTF